MRQLLRALLEEHGVTRPEKQSEGTLQYVKVNFDLQDQRQVLADGYTIGLTGVELVIPEGFYVITLSGDHYSPSQWTGPISGTSPRVPLHIQFTRT